jgi:hypothetical protein
MKRFIAFAALHKREYDKWAGVVGDAGVKPE